MLIFSRFTNKGTAYEIGNALGGLLEQSQELREGNKNQENVSNENFNKKITLLKEFCPNVIEEANGVSDRTKIPVKQLAIFSDNVTTVGACSQIAFMPSITSNGHLLVGRSYEFASYDEKNLMNIKEEGYPAHIGFSLFLFGRFDGINEHGLVVTMSSCGSDKPYKGEGFWFPLIIRIILDRCTNVDEAIYCLKEIPVRCCSNILIADRYGNAVLAEIACCGDDRKITFRKSDEYLISTNHYVNSDMLKYDNHHGNHSEIRYRIIENMIKREKGNISEDKIKKLLSDEIPEGISCPYYNDCLGTLHSMFFDVTECKTDISFGQPSINSFENVSFNELAGISFVSVPYENKSPADPNDFWQTLPPGGV